MATLAVIAETFSVVCREHYQRALVEPEALELREYAPDAVVGERDLTRIAIVGEARLERDRRRIGKVRVVVVEPEEERTRAVLAQEGDPVARDLCRAAGIEVDGPRLGLARDEGARVVQQSVRGDGDLLRLDAGRIEIAKLPEALGDSRRAVQDDGRDLRARGIAGVAQPLGERDALLGELVHAVLAHAMVIGVEAGQDRGVRRQRVRR